jgi:hypothetical protein
MIEDHASAVEDFTLLIKKNPKNAHAYFRRAFSNKALKVKRDNMIVLYRNIRMRRRTLRRRRSWIH